jgi:lipoprotein-anchoring transpeptidase ErfK/SrfK
VHLAYPEVVTLTPSTRRVRRIAVIASLVAVCALVLSACGTSSPKATTSTPVVLPASSAPAPTTSSAAAVSPPAPATSAPAKPAIPVHIRTLNFDGVTYGVGMPVIVYFDKKITDATAFAKAASVKVDGADAGGAWYFEVSGAQNEVYEAHYRQQHYWKANSAVAVNLPMKGLSAGAGMAYDDSLTLNFQIGAAQLTTVDGNTKTLTETVDGAPKFSFPVSLGKAKTPTYTGTKVVMEKDKIQHMVGTPDDPYSLQVPWSVRLTNSGEFIHSAPWNTKNLGNHSTSNGCTNLSTANALLYFNNAVIGDPVVYTNTGGATMPVDDGYGDWNVPWSAWQGGGRFTTT